MASRKLNAFCCTLVRDSYFSFLQASQNLPLKVIGSNYLQSRMMRSPSNLRPEIAETENLLRMFLNLPSDVYFLSRNLLDKSHNLSNEQIF